MPLPTPNLDDRRFQDIVDDARRAIPRYCPEWTDHNVHDPGITLVELFAHMVETMLFRLNRVPEKSYITFMDLMGIRLKEAAAARTELTFWLTAPAAEPILIPAGTEVATTQTAVAEAVTFSTDRDLTISPPALRYCLVSADERTYDNYSDTLDLAGIPFPAFADPPAPGNAFYLGFDNDLSGHLLAADFDIREVTGTGIDPTDPPLSWEALCKLRGDATAWVEAEIEYEQTAGLNQSGQVAVHLPPRMFRHSLQGIEAYWVRCRFRQSRGGQAAYQTSPRIFKVAAASYGGTVSATHAFALSEEVIGRSDGLPGQSFKLQFTPVLPRAKAEQVEVQAEDGSWEPWHEVEHFGDSGPNDPHVTVDSVQGTVSFGPTIRDPQGGERQYGRVPRIGALVRMGRYRCGGGAVGNLAPGKINVLKTGVPFIDRVRNRVAAVGGRDAETIEHAALRAPKVLRTSFRAVTAEDYEHLAQEASRSVARVCCRQPRPGAPGAEPGVVRVLIVPTVSNPARRVAPDELALPAALIDDVEAFLNERRLLTTALRVEAPPVSQVRVEARVKARPRFDPERVRAEVGEALNRFLNPIVGGQDGQGWPFGRDLYISEIFALIQGVPGVEYIEAARMQVVGQEAPVSKVTLGPDGIITSGLHVIAVTP